jgi:ribosomal protein S27E
MSADRYVGTAIPHSDFGDPECCGCLNGIYRGDIAVIECNECGAIIRTVAADEIEKALHEIEQSMDLATAICSHCGATHISPGFSRLLVFTCEECGKVTTFSDSNSELSFG